MERHESHEAAIVAMEKLKAAIESLPEWAEVEHVDAWLQEGVRRDLIHLSNSTFRRMFAGCEVNVKLDSHVHVERNGVMYRTYDYRLQERKRPESFTTTLPAIEPEYVQVAE